MNCFIEIRLTTDKSVLINHFPITIMNYLSNIMKLMTITFLSHALIYIMLREKVTTHSSVKVLCDLYQVFLDGKDFQKYKFFSSKYMFLFLHFMNILINVPPRKEGSLHIVVPLTSYWIILLTALLLFSLRVLKIILSLQGSLN
jgi:hypothetical protein